MFAHMRCYLPRWKIFLGLMPIFYTLLYAPYGLNETDGGFMTSVAWQVSHGRTLYAECLYVRPPLPVWLHVLFLKVMPETGQVLAERALFYGKVALYCALGAHLLRKGQAAWRLAVVAFVVSAHCYPAAAWHTVDGILFAVLGFYLLPKNGALGAAALLGALLCKQSFYPLVGWLLLGMVWDYGKWRTRSSLYRQLFYGGVAAAFWAVVWWASGASWAGFWQLSRAVGTGSEAFQHGIVDFFRIQPLVAAVVPLCALGAWSRLRPYRFWIGLAGIVWLLGIYSMQIYQRQTFTIPFAQARLLFWVGVGYACYLLKEKPTDATAWRALQLSSVSWCAAISWGYNLPILFVLPGVWAILALGERWQAHSATRWAGYALFGLTLGTFYYAYTYIYHDGRRADMNTFMNEVSPQLWGIRSTPATYALYRELHVLARTYPTFQALPSFCAAHALTQTAPVLPLDWVVAREMGGDTATVIRAFEQYRPVLLVEKSQWTRLQTDPEMAVARALIGRCQKREETVHWVVYAP